MVEVALNAEESSQTLAEGVEYQVWTFDGTAPGPGDPRAARRHDPVHPDERLHARTGALDRLPRGADAVGRELPAGRARRDALVRLGRALPGCLHVPLRRAAGAAPHLERHVRRDHRRADRLAAGARVRAGLERVLPGRRTRGRRVRGRRRQDGVGRTPTTSSSTASFNQYLDAPLEAGPNELDPPLGDERRARRSRTPST